MQNSRLWNRNILIALACALVVTTATPAEADDRTALRDAIASLEGTQDATVDGAPIAAVRGISRLYARRDYEPAWTDRDMVRQLYDQVQRSWEHGLNPEDFHVRQLGTRVDPGSRANDPKFRAETEILCTDALARLAFTLKFGKLDPTGLDPAWNFERSIDGRDIVGLFNEALNRGDIANTLEGVVPDLEDYDQLRLALIAYRDIVARGGWPQVPEGEGLKLGSTGPRVVALRNRLTASGDLTAPAPADPGVYDAALEAAVIRFQERHGITADGKVGPRSLEELNVPAAARIDQIRANLERVRWVCRTVEDTYIMVDIAGYSLDLVKESETVWQTNVQVGKPFHATPVFQSKLKYVEFNCTWTIPSSILHKETLPAIRKDPDYLSRNNMIVLTTGGKVVDPTTIDWAATAGKRFPYIIRQEPGRRNALGQVKFIFPNKYMVYLHDTPSKGLFARTERAFSHGCIRTENPFDLAVYLLEDQGWDRARVDSVIASRETTRVNFVEPITVMLLYWTAQVDADGAVRFRRDLYSRDAPIVEGLNEPFRIDPPQGLREAVDKS